MATSSKNNTADSPVDAPAQAADSAPQSAADAPKTPKVNLSPVEEARAKAASEQKDAPPAEPESPMSISMYCVARGKPARHAAGLMAYTPVRYATPSQWDQIFKSY